MTQSNSLGFGQPPATIRFFCRVIRRAVSTHRPGTPKLVALKGVPFVAAVNPFTYWDKTANDYAKAILASGLPMCCLSTAGIVDHTDLVSHWHDLAHRFMAPMADMYVNVVCSDNGEVHKFFTVGVPNVAITGVRPRPPTEVELKTLRHYNAILCPTEDDAAALRDLGLQADFVPPQPDALRPILERFIP